MSPEHLSSDYPSPLVEEEDDQGVLVASSEIADWESPPAIIVSADQPPTYDWMSSLKGRGGTAYYNPVNYKITSGINVLLDVAEKGDLAEEETKGYLKHHLDLNAEIIKYQKKLMEHQEAMVKASDEKHVELIAKLDSLSSDLRAAEQRVKEAIESKFILSESDIIRSIKESPSGYTLVFSKIFLTFTITLLVVYYLLGVEIIKPTLLYAAIIAFSTFLIMGKKGASSGS